MMNGPSTSPSSSWIETLQTLDSKSFVTAFFQSRTRPDGRLFSTCRETSLALGVLKLYAAGSSLVRMGGTHVLCGVTLLIGTPSHYPQQGDIVVSMATNSSQTAAIGNSNRMSSSRNMNAIATEIQTIASSMIDLESLCISKGEAAWRLQVSIEVMNDEGNVFDASLLAVVAAIAMDTRLPPTQSKVISKSNKTIYYIVESKDEKEDSSKQAVKLNYIPFALTLGLYYNDDQDEKEAMRLIADPTHQEESALEGRIRLVVEASERKIIEVQHVGSYGIDRDTLAIAAHMAFGRANELKDLFQGD